MPEHVLGRCNEAAQETGLKNSEKNISMSYCVFFYGCLLELFGVLLAPFQITSIKNFFSLLFGTK